MALTFKTPAQVSKEYLDNVKGLKPEVNTDQTDSDWWVRGQVIGGVVSGVYADQLLLQDDPFPQSSRRDALGRSLDLYFGAGFQDPTNAEGPVEITGASGTPVPQNTQMVYTPNGNIYRTLEAATIGEDGTVEVQVISVGTGQSQNLLAGASLTISSPPSGVDSAVTVQSTGIADGRDAETLDEARARVLTRIRSPLAGGNVTDYKQFATDADPAVVSASVVRFYKGLGTVGVVITAGTTDIDSAVDNDQAVNLVPSSQLLATVQSYVDAQNPTTDIAYVLPPALREVDVTVYARFSTGDQDTILSGQTLSQGELLRREVKRAIYKTGIGGRKLGASGYVVAAEIEEMIDLNLSAMPYQVGAKVPIIVDREVGDLSATGFNLMLSQFEIPIPGTITITEM